MKKKGFIAGALALCMVLGGTGYAYWTDALHITTTATTGDLDVKFVDLGYLAQYDNEGGSARAHEWAITDGTVYGTVFADIIKASSGNSVNDPGTIKYSEKGGPAYALNNVTFDAMLEEDGTVLEHDIPTSAYKAGSTKASKNIALTVNKIFPGYAQVFRSDIVNDGEVAAKLTDIVGKVDGIDMQNNPELMNEIGVALYIHTEIASDEDIFGLASCFSDDELFDVGGVKFVRLSALTSDTASTKEKIASKLLEISWKKGERMDAYFGVAMDADAEGKYTSGNVDLVKAGKADNDALTENSDQIKVVLDFYWAQYNNTGHETDANAPIIAKGNDLKVK